MHEPRVVQKTGRTQGARVTAILFYSILKLLQFQTKSHHAPQLQLTRLHCWDIDDSCGVGLLSCYHAMLWTGICIWCIWKTPSSNHCCCANYPVWHGSCISSQCLQSCHTQHSSLIYSGIIIKQTPWTTLSRTVSVLDFKVVWIFRLTYYQVWVNFNHTLLHLVHNVFISLPPSYPPLFSLSLSLWHINRHQQMDQKH